jgi:hypothetical protein
VDRRVEAAAINAMAREHERNQPPDGAFAVGLDELGDDVVDGRGSASIRRLWAATLASRLNE